MIMPVSSDDFRLIGQRYLSTEIVSEIDRLLPLGKADLSVLQQREYDPAQLTALEQWRVQLTGESGELAAQRGQKKASRRTELARITEAKRLLRSGIDVAHRTLAARQPPAGEAPEDTQRLVRDVLARIEALGGPLRYDSALIRTRLTQLIALLGSAELAPSPAAQPARAALLASLDAAVKALPNLAETKRSLQAEAKGGTAALDEVDGRAYWALKLLCQAGRASFIERGEPARAAEYHLGLRNGASHPAKAPAAPAPQG